MHVCTYTCVFIHGALIAFLNGSRCCNILQNYHKQHRYPFYSDQIFRKGKFFSSITFQLFVERKLHEIVLTVKLEKKKKNLKRS